MNEDAGKNVNQVHLGYIQMTIQRMGHNSFQVKTWCITIIAALLAFYLPQKKEDIRYSSTIIAILSVLSFCMIDAYYLFLERGYRRLYDIVAKLDTTCKVADYDMKIPQSARGFKNFMKAILSRSIGVFYGVLAVFLLIIIYC